VVRPFAQRRVLLGVTGGIASYKTATLARLLTQAGAEVDVVMSRSALEFVGAVTFEALTGRPVHTALIAAGHALDHIRLARAAHAIVVAPATADFVARAAQGQADDLLTAALLAADAPVLIAPAMNDRMWAHGATARNVARLRELGYRVLDPEIGPLAVGEGSGAGRLPEPETILAHIGRLLDGDGVLRGRRVVVTAGGTREPIDPVRFIANRSSGKMGVAIAAAAWRRGADVTLIAGPLSVGAPVGPTLVSVETTEQMRDAVAAHLDAADVLVMAAAPADFRPARPAEQKIKKSAAPAAIAVEPTDDILLATRGQRADGAVIVGFALETESALASGREKLDRKALDLVVVNDATEAGAGFAIDTNRVTLLAPDQAPETLPVLPKTEVADAILDRVEALLRGR
jgi:phosphopantothenoylcysteine decarboxylase / phosphopantothenate---cysteine ligase